MPKIDMKAYNEATALGDASRIVPGCYVARIIGVRTSGTDKLGNKVDYVYDKSYVKLIYDIAEGEYAGYFSDQYWSKEENDYGHCIYLSWKNLSALKGNMEAIEESNPGFDPMAAFNADRWDLFVGRYVGIVLGDEEYEADDGEVKTRMRLPNLRSVSDVREGRCKTPKTKKMGGGSSSKPAEAKKAEPVNYDDIPF